MCGRSSLSKQEKELEERFNATFYSEDLERYNPLPNYNVAPTHMHPVITNKDSEHLQYYRWGLIPFWAKDHKIGYKMINARIETILQKPSYKNAVRKRRCLVPFDGFYEWKKTPKGKKIPYRIVTTNIEIFTIAGIWETWKSPEGEIIHSFSLITQDANKLVGKIHDRMPAILLPEQEALWVDENLSAEEAIKLIEPYPEEFMRAYTVSTRVNNVRENDKALIEEVTYTEENDLFS